MLPPPEAGLNMLEIGSGTGHWSDFFAEHGYDVTGVDRSREMVERSRSKGIPRATFHAADAHRLPYADGQFDAAAAVSIRISPSKDFCYFLNRQFISWQ